MYSTSSLDNQLTVITEHIPSARSVSIGILVDAGPQDEPSDQLGVAHLLEHALFLGTSRRSARDISGMIDEAGGQMGAFTSRDYTCLYAHIMDDYCTYAWDLLGDMLVNSVFNEDSLARERDVIVQELGMQQEDPVRQLHEVLKRSIWPDHPLGRHVAGDIPNVSRLTRDHVIQFARDNYVPSRMVVAAVGKVDHEHALLHAKDAFWQLTGQQQSRKTVPAEFHSAVNVIPTSSSNSYFALALPSVPYNSHDRYGVHALNSILGSGMSSRLCLGLRESLGWVYDIHSSYQAYRAAGTVVVEGACATENLRQTLGKTLYELMEIAHEGVSEEELRRTKLQIRGQHQLASDSIHTRMSRGLTQQHYFGRTLSEDEVIEGFESVTCDQVQRVAQEMVASQKLGLTVFGDCDKSGTAEQLQELLHDSLVSQLT